VAHLTDEVGASVSMTAEVLRLCPCLCYSDAAWCLEKCIAWLINWHVLVFHGQACNNGGGSGWWFSFPELVDNNCVVRNNWFMSRLSHSAQLRCCNSHSLHTTTNRLTAAEYNWLIRTAQLNTTD